MSEEVQVEGASPTPNGALRWIVLAVLIALAASLAWRYGDLLSLESLAGREAQLRELQNAFPLRSMAVAFLIYFSVTGLSLPGATGLTLVCGWYFGFWKALLIVSFGSTAGALMAFLMSRYLLHDWVQSRLHKQLANINAAVQREGAYYLFSLRLIPVVPFFVINAVMGLTDIRAFTFWWVSQLGMLPGTAAYVYAARRFPACRTCSMREVWRYSVHNCWSLW